MAVDHLILDIEDNRDGTESDADIIGIARYKPSADGSIELHHPTHATPATGNLVHRGSEGSARQCAAG